MQQPDIVSGCPHHEQEVGHEEDCHLRSSIPKNVHQVAGVVNDGGQLVQEAASNEGAKEDSQHLYHQY